MMREATNVTSRVHSHRCGAFTLIELMVVVAIIALLLAILMPAIRSARDCAKTLACSSNMRTVSMEFQLFADGHSDLGRGDSEQLGSSQFWIDDFQEQLYGIDEFWDHGPQRVVRIRSTESQMICPAAPGWLDKTKAEEPCGVESLTPLENVSIGLNKRLHRAVVKFAGVSQLAPVSSTRVRANILHHPYVPIVLDVDGRSAMMHDVRPFYIAPPIDGCDDPYASGRYWHPSKRHRGKVNVAFVGGHVLRSDDPAKQRWDWSYQAEVHP